MKCKKDEPVEYHLVIPLSIISKLYARRLCWKLLDCLEGENILAVETESFRAGQSTLDGGLVLYHLIEK